MTMIKRGTISSRMIVSSSVWICPTCGFSKIQTENYDSHEKCPKDDCEMKLVASSWGLLQRMEASASIN